MHLLPANAHQVPFIFLLYSIIALFILYFTIKAAVAAGTKEMRDNLILQNYLKIRELKMKGVTVGEIMEDTEKAFTVN